MDLGRRSAARTPDSAVWSAEGAGRSDVPLSVHTDYAARFGGRVLLLGDAAGAMYPALGQGANQQRDRVLGLYIYGTRRAPCKAPQITFFCIAAI